MRLVLALISVERARKQRKPSTHSQSLGQPVRVERRLERQVSTMTVIDDLCEITATLAQSQAYMRPHTRVHNDIM